MQNKREHILKLDNLIQTIGRESNHLFMSILPNNITPAQFFLLKIIVNAKDCKAKDIANILEISPAAATNMLERLYKNNLIERIRSDEDRRIVQIKLSQAGEELFKTINQKRLDILEQLFERVSEEELMHATNIFSKILSTSKV